MSINLVWLLFIKTGEQYSAVEKTRPRDEDHKVEADNLKANIYIAHIQSQKVNENIS